MGADSPTDAGAAPAEPLIDRLYAKLFWRLLPFLMLCYVIAYLDRVNVGFAKLQMLDDLGFSQTVYGLGAGIFFIGYFLFEVPSNVILHKVGARIWIARIMITWGAISAAMMFVDSVASFYILRFLLGVAEAGFFPGVIFYLTQWYPAARPLTTEADFHPTPTMRRSAVERRLASASEKLERRRSCLQPEDGDPSNRFAPALLWT